MASRIETVESQSLLTSAATIHSCALKMDSAARISVSPSFIGGQWAVGFGGELGAKPELCQTPPEPRGRIVWVAFTQVRQCEGARGAVGIEHHGNLPSGRGAAQQFDED